MTKDQVLFEEQRALKVGTVLQENPATLQVEMPSGKRAKIKAAQVLWRFQQPPANKLLPLSEEIARTIEIPFLWEVASDKEFDCEELALAYFGHAPSAVEITALIMCLQQAPIYFHRKGKGVFRRAPKDILEAALAQQALRQQHSDQIAAWSAELRQGRCPDAIRAALPRLLYDPDHNALETRALKEAAAALQLSEREVLQRSGAITSSYDYHLGAFLYSYFPQGVGFAEDVRQVPSIDITALPLAAVAAFSIDSADTTEIDDAFSVTPQGDGTWQVGVHIAVPALGFDLDSPLGKVARRRLSTVYFPGGKYTMLPDEILPAFSLTANSERPALSLYFHLAADLSIMSTTTRLERVPIAANLRLHELEGLDEAQMANGTLAISNRTPAISNGTLAMSNGTLAISNGAALQLLWRAACAFEQKRGKPSHPEGLDFDFAVDWRVPEGHVTILSRQRGTPVDKLVAEWMILTNSTWGQQLAAANIAAIYRCQQGGKTSMSLTCGPHEGLGVTGYAWCTSPLRRFCDLLNQWQLLAMLESEASSERNTLVDSRSTLAATRDTLVDSRSTLVATRDMLVASDSQMLSALHNFSTTYDGYAQFQRQMERYWSLRWLAQEKCQQIPATHLRGDLVRVSCFPWVLPIPDLAALPTLTAGQPLTLTVESFDLWNVTLRCKLLAA